MTRDKFTSLLTRDPVVTIMFCIAIMLIVMDFSFAGIVARTHNIEILKVPMLASGVFALVGIVFGLVRSLRNTSGKRTA